MWTVVNRCESLVSHFSTYIMNIFSRTEAKNLVFMGVNCSKKSCIVSDSLCQARPLLLSSITGFLITKVTQTNSVNQNLRGRKFGSLVAASPTQMLHSPGQDVKLALVDWSCVWSTIPGNLQLPAFEAHLLCRWLLVLNRGLVSSHHPRTYV